MVSIWQQQGFGQDLIFYRILKHLKTFDIEGLVWQWQDNKGIVGLVEVWDKKRFKTEYIWHWGVGFKALQWNTQLTRITLLLVDPLHDGMGRNIITLQLSNSQNEMFIFHTVYHSPVHLWLSSNKKI